MDMSYICFTFDSNRIGTLGNIVDIEKQCQVDFDFDFFFFFVKVYSENNKLSNHLPLVAYIKINIFKYIYVNATR